MSIQVKQCLICLLVVVSPVFGAPTKNKYIFDDSVCQLVPEFSARIKQEIKNLTNDANKIIDFVVNGPDKGITYKELSKFVDKVNIFYLYKNSLHLSLAILPSLA